MQTKLLWCQFVMTNESLTVWRLCFSCFFLLYLFEFYMRTSQKIATNKKLFFSHIYNLSTNVDVFSYKMGQAATWKYRRYFKHRETLVNVNPILLPSTSRKKTLNIFVLPSEILRAMAICHTLLVQQDLSSIHDQHSFHSKFPVFYKSLSLAAEAANERMGAYIACTSPSLLTVKWNGCKGLS